MKWVPKTLYNIQCLDSWLHFFLSRRVIEEALDITFFHTPAAFGADMHDVHDSPAWKDLHTFLQPSRYNLVFGLYIDWFQAYGNKIAGMFLYVLYHSYSNCDSAYQAKRSLLV